MVLENYKSLLEWSLFQLNNSVTENTAPVISIKALAKVPFLPLPFLSNEQRLELREQSKQVLRLSKIKNSGGKVAIIYDLDNPSEYVAVKGDISSINIYADTKAKQMIEQADKTKRLAVICIHNHPNKSFFSINDLLFFEAHSSIKIMVLLDNEGRAAFMARSQCRTLTNTVRLIKEASPDIEEKMLYFYENNPGKDIKISDIIPDVELRKEIVHASILQLSADGVFVSNFLNQKQASEITFPSFLYEENISPSKTLNNRADVSFNYLENGEDGYEWDFLGC